MWICIVIELEASLRLCNSRCLQTNIARGKIIIKNENSYFYNKEYQFGSVQLLAKVGWNHS